MATLAAPPPHGLTRRGSATRDDILAAARVVFARMGHGGARLEDIAAEAGTSRTGVYHYFSSRRMILIEVGRAAMVGFKAVMEVAREIPDEWEPSDLVRLIDAHLRFLDEHGTVISTWTQATWDDPELRDLGLGSQIEDFEVLGVELARLRGTSDVDAVHEGIAFTGMVERLWYYARSGGAGIVDEAGLRRSLFVEVHGLLTRRPHRPPRAQPPGFRC